MLEYCERLAITPLLNYSITRCKESSSPHPFLPPISRDSVTKSIASKRQARIGFIATSWTDILSITFHSGPEIVRIVRGLTSLPLDVHLMIEHADHYVPRFVKAGANSITVHVEPEAKHDVQKTLKQIRDTGCRAGLTLNPETAFDLIEPLLHKIDILLVMTVHPGFGGQQFRADQMHKVKRARSLNRNLDIEVDGGINADTARLSIENGANVLVAGTSIFHSKDYAKAIRELRGE